MTKLFYRIILTVTLLACTILVTLAITGVPYQHSFHIAQQEQKNVAQAQAIAEEINNSWGEVIGEPVIIKTPESAGSSKIFSYKVKDKETKKVVIITIGTSTHVPNSMIRLY